MMRAGLVLVTAVALIAGPVTAAGASPPDTPQKQLDGVVSAGAVGALAEVRDGHGVWRGTSGVAALGTRRPVPVDGRFRAGSVTKSFLATVVLQLAVEHRLRLSDPVEAWLPGVVPDGDRITVRELLNHTSGLYDVVATLPMPPSPEFFANRWRTWTATEMIRRALVHPPTVEPPGSTFAYSNTDYLVLGQIVEKATGRSYAQEIERRIIRPLRLTGTTLPGTSPRIPGPHPHGYVPAGPTQLVDYTAMNPSVFGSAGELISTTADLNRFYAALLGGRLLPRPLLDDMLTPGTRGGDYGLGLFVRTTTCGVRLYGHDGDALAYQAWSYSTRDGHRQVTLAFTPNFHGDTDPAVDALLDRVACG
jgi:D-alanyl-D-alanine carboxypeptidase